MSAILALAVFLELRWGLSVSPALLIHSLGVSFSTVSGPSPSPWSLEPGGFGLRRAAGPLLCAADAPGSRVAAS